MDETTNSGGDPGAWFSATLGTAIGVYVDRTLNQGMQIPTGTGYGMDANGNLYKIGQPAPQATAGKGNSTLLLLLLVGFAVWELK